MDAEKRQRQLKKLIEYILGRNPYEFGLVPDRDGFVKIKELIKAINEEEHFRHIRRSHIDELLITLSDPIVEIKDIFIRAAKREDLPPWVIPERLPKILYSAVKESAYPHVIENGLSPSFNDRVILSSDMDLMVRIGKRIASDPVILHVNVEQAEKEGVLITQCGDSIFLSKIIPPDCFSGPPLSKMKKPVKRPNAHKKIERPVPGGDVTLGDVVQERPAISIQEKKDRDSWKNNKKRIRRQKEKNWFV